MKALGLVSLLILSLSVTSCQPSNQEQPESVSADVAPTRPVEEPPPTLEPSPDPVEVEVFDTTTHSIDEASSLWVVVNKHRPLNPPDYEPDELVSVSLPSNYDPLLRQDAAMALGDLFADASEAGVSLVVHSTYRSYSLQQRIKRQSVERYGEEVSDGRSARAGYSEHQTGLAVDLTHSEGNCTLLACFGETDEGRWLAENAWEYGFIVRYPEGKTGVTGYVYEPWHLRFVGLELAAEIKKQGYPTLEEFFGLPPAPTYSD